jgi:hypothetical protein
MLASVLVFIPFRQNQEQGLPDRNRPAAFGAIKLQGLELIKISLALGWWLSTGRDKVKWSFFHGQNLWISTMDYVRDLGASPQLKQEKLPLNSQ